MERVSIRDLGDHRQEAIDQVARGREVIITRDGKDVAQLCPVKSGRISWAAFADGWSRLPPMDLTQLRADLDRILDPYL